MNAWSGAGFKLAAPAAWRRTDEAWLPGWWRASAPEGTLAIALAARYGPGFEPRIELWRVPPGEPRAFRLDVDRHAAGHMVVRRTRTLAGRPSEEASMVLEHPHERFTLFGFEVVPGWRWQWGTATGSETWPEHAPWERRILADIEAIRRSLVLD